MANANHQLKLIDTELVALKEQTDLTENRHRERLGNLTDVYETNSRYLSVSADKENALAEQKRFEGDLIELIGVELFSTLDGESGLDISYIVKWLDANDYERLAEESAEVDVEVNLAKQRVKTAKYRYQQQNSGFLPRLSLEAQSVVTETTDSLFTSEEDRTRNEIMLRLDVPLFAGFGTYSKSKEAYLNIQSAKEFLRAENISLEKKISTAFASFKANENRVVLLERSYDNIVKAVDLRRQGYLQGLSSNLNFLEALSTSFASLRRLDRAKYEYATSWVQAISSVKNVGFQEAAEIDLLFKPHSKN